MRARARRPPDNLSINSGDLLLNGLLPAARPVGPDAFKCNEQRDELARSEIDKMRARLSGCWPVCVAPASLQLNKSRSLLSPGVYMSCC